MNDHRNEISEVIISKGYRIKAFLRLINRSRNWYYIHSNGGKDYEFLKLSVKGLEPINK